MRRKIVFVLYIIISLLLVGCENISNKNGKSIEIVSAALSSEERGIKLDVSIDFESLSISENDIISYGIIIVKNKAAKLSEITMETKDSNLDTTEVENNQATFTISNIDKSEYTTPYSIRAYIEYQDKDNQVDYIYASTYEEVSLYSLAQASDTEYANEVVYEVESERVSEVSLTINTENYTVSTLSTKYLVELAKDQNVITITVTLKDGYLFSEDVSLIANENVINESEYIMALDSLTYTLEDPNSVTVSVSFNPDGGSWTNQNLSKLSPDNVLTATTLNDFSGLTYTVLDKTSLTYKYFYKVFLKYDSNIEAYQVVAVDSATNNIIGLNLPDYDYVLAVHDNSGGSNENTIIQSYAATEDSVGMYVIFGTDITQYSSGDISTSFYTSEDMSRAFEENLFAAVELPTPYKKEHKFLGWNDGTNTYTVFPTYTADQNITNITYTAIWEPFSADDFSVYMLSYLYNQCMAKNLVNHNMAVAMFHL